ncbi:N-terminal nucleophile aminohydrolase [Ramicandelaber brevisporus]|nr:N-terminal nucleophile aminohydrolase [Ramicandelaber brevisporus]
MAYVVVHAGAGVISTRDELALRAACTEAARIALAILNEPNQSSAKSGDSVAMKAVIAASASLEDNGCTNAGCGSNLNRDGVVECDALCMDGRNGATGAVSGMRNVRNPIKAAHLVMTEESKGADSRLGLVPPIMLAGSGVEEYLKQKNASDLLLEQQQQQQQGQQQPELDGNEETMMYDTVGVVCIDHDGNVAAGVSSGGIALKYSGRVGEAAVFGSGCWARNGCESSNRYTVGCSASGMGEQIMKTALSRICAEQLEEDVDDPVAVLSTTVRHKFLNSWLLSNVSKRHAGLVMLRQSPFSEESKSTELLAVHTTPAMVFAYASERSSRVRSAVSRLKDGSDLRVLALPL